METWRVSDELSVDLGEVRKVVVRMVAGELTVAAGSTPHIDVRRESGAEVTVEIRNGTLYVSQPEPELAPIQRMVKWLTEGARHRASVAISVAPESSIDLTTVSADVVASGIRAGTRVKSVSGDVTLSGLKEDVDVKTVSGEIEAKGLAGGLKLKTVSGGIGVVDGACRFVDAKTVSGDVLLDLDLDPAGTYDVSTVSGNVAVRTVSEPSMSVDMSSLSGHLVSDFGIAWGTGPGRRHVRETIGDGGARIFVKTVSGDLRVLRGREAAA